MHIQTTNTSKVTGSFMFWNLGLISIDYAIKHRNKFKPETTAISAPNANMSNTLDNSGELRIGGV
jgi:hypothetical protein